MKCNFQYKDIPLVADLAPPQAPQAKYIAGLASVQWTQAQEACTAIWISGIGYNG